MERNFRIGYYGKVVVSGIEDKKTLENLLKDETIDEEKLANYCILHTVPAMYRFLIWKILTNIIPVHSQSHKFVMQQRKEQYQDLHHALTVMHKIEDNTHVSKVFLLAYLLENSRLGLEVYHESWHEVFTSIATALCKMLDDSVIAYWLSKKVFNIVDVFGQNYEDYESGFKNATSNVLLRENAKLHEHLTSILNTINELPYNKWYKNCFAGIYNIYI